MVKRFVLTTNNKNTIRIAILVLVSYVFAYILFGALPNIFGLFNHQINDHLLKLRYRVYGQKELYPYIVHVDLNETIFQTLNYSYRDRALFGDVIDILNKLYVRSIVFDILFLQPTEPLNDAPLISATERFDNIYYPIILSVENMYSESKSKAGDRIVDENLWHPKVTKEGEPFIAHDVLPTFSELSRSSKGLGHITCYPDRDGVYRRFPLLIRYKDGYIPSLSLRMVCDYLNVSTDKIEVMFGKKIILYDAVFPEGLEKDISIPIDKKGQIIINYIGPWSDSFPHYSVVDILSCTDDPDIMELWIDEMEGDIVIISDVSTGGRDIGTIPFETVYPLSGLHSTIANSILTENFLNVFPNWGYLLIDLFFMFLFLYIALRFRPVGFTLSALLLFVVLLGFNGWLHMMQNKLINIVRPSIAFILVLISINAYRFIMEEKEKAFLRHSLESYFAPPLLNKILRSPERLQNNEKKELTVLFSDIAGFTSWCAAQDPEKIRVMLNDYFKEMADIVFKYEGTIDKYIGDGLMVFFGDPVEHKDHTARAVRAAVEMQKRVRELNELYKKRYNIDLKIRIGINKGEVIVGNMGSEDRIDYTVLGSNVNLAQRLESSAPIGGILVSESVFQEVKDFLNSYKVKRIKVKGIGKELKVFEF
jgi:adenylate cyclase